MAGSDDLTSLYFSFEGRINRSTFWIHSVLILGVVRAILFVLALAATGTERLMVWHTVVTLLLLWPSLALNVKRCHDRNHSGWFVLVSLIPFVSLWYLVEIGFLPGTPGPNRFDGAELAGELGAPGEASGTAPPGAPRPPAYDDAPRWFLWLFAPLALIFLVYLVLQMILGEIPW